MSTARRKPAAKKTAARKPAAKKRATQPEIQVNRTPTQEVSEQDRLEKEQSQVQEQSDDVKSTDPNPESRQDDQSDGYDEDQGEDGYDSVETREAELEEVQRVHAERTGGGEVHYNELRAQREEHNARVGG